MGMARAALPMSPAPAIEDRAITARSEIMFITPKDLTLKALKELYSKGALCSDGLITSFLGLPRRLRSRPRQPASEPPGSGPRRHS